MSVRLFIRRSGEGLDLTIEGVAQNLCHLKIKAKASGDYHVMFDPAIAVEGSLVGGEHHREEPSNNVELRQPVDDADRHPVGLGRVHGMTQGQNIALGNFVGFSQRGISLSTIDGKTRAFDFAGNEIPWPSEPEAV